MFRNLSDRDVACATHANLSSDLALVLGRLGGVLLIVRMCYPFHTASVRTQISFSVVIHRLSRLHLMTLLYLTLRLTLRSTRHIGQILFRAFHTH